MGLMARAGPEGYSSCCQVNEALVAQDKLPVDIPITQRAIRNQDFKIVQNSSVNCSGGDPILVNQFYRISENAPIPKLDRAKDNLLDGRVLTKRQQRNYDILLKRLARLDESVVQCEGDGNLDLVINDKDITGWLLFSRLNAEQSSWYDFNLDGLTNGTALAIVG